MDFRPWTRNKLQEFCREHQLSAGGTKDELEERINEALCEGSWLTVEFPKQKIFRVGVVMRVLRQRKFEVQYEDDGKTAIHSLDDADLNVHFTYEEASDADTHVSAEPLDNLSVHGLKSGSQISVLWDVTGKRKKTQFWRLATVVKPVTGQSDEEGNQIYQIVYGPLEGSSWDDMEYEKAVVSFINYDELLDSRGSKKRWLWDSNPEGEVTEEEYDFEETSDSDEYSDTDASFEEDLSDLPSSWGYEKGTRIQVLWSIVEERRRESSPVWLPATLGKPVKHRVDKDGRQMYHIKYDPLEVLGVDDFEKAKVSFISSTDLMDSRGDVMSWKLEGEEEDAPSDDEEEGSEDEEYSDSGSESTDFQAHGNGGYDIGRLTASMSNLGLNVFGRPNKRALVVGCSYRGTTSKLGGTLHDARDIQKLLQEHFQYQPGSIMLLTDDHSDSMLLPTRSNILKGFEWLMRDLRPGDTLFFFFAGHGGTEDDPTGKEWRGHQTICPSDVHKEGAITDSQIYQKLVRPLPQNTTLHALIDSCHSGTALNLPYNAVLKRGAFEGWEEEYPGESWKRDTDGGLAVQFSAARADQLAGEKRMGTGGERRGAATYAFTEAIKRHKQTWGFNIRYSELLEWMSDALRKSKFKDQDPQMSASTQFDPRRRKVEI